MLLDDNYNIDKLGCDWIQAFLLQLTRGAFVLQLTRGARGQLTRGARGSQGPISTVNSYMSKHNFTTNYTDAKGQLP